MIAPLLALRACERSRGGYVLIVVMLVVVVLGLAAYTFADVMSSEFTVAFRGTEAAQSRAHAHSAVNYALAVLSDPTTYQQTLASNPYDNAAFFAGVPLGDANGHRGGGQFALLNLDSNAGGTGEGKYILKYGLTDESGKINLNAMMRIDSTGTSLQTMLGLLPNMTDDTAKAIKNWMLPVGDSNADADAPTYDNYQPKGGPLSTLDELLLVQGVTPQLLYGNDRNRNGRADPGEADGNDFNRGWSDYLTVYGHELNIDSTGAPRIYVNGTINADLQKQLTDALGQPMADYIIAYRLYSQTPSTNPIGKGQVQGNPGTDLNAAVNTSLANPKSKRQVKNSVLAMLNTRVTLPKAPGSRPQDPTIVIDCPLNNRDTFVKLLPAILDKTTAKSNYELNPRINISTCSPDLFACLPGLTADDVQAAIAARANITPGTPEYVTGAWLVTQAGQRPDIFQQLERYITGQTMTYRVHALGYFAKGGPTARVEAVIDTNGGYPRIVYFRDLTELGAGFTPPR